MARAAELLSSDPGPPISRQGKEVRPRRGPVLQYNTDGSTTHLRTAADLQPTGPKRSATQRMLDRGADEATTPQEQHEEELETYEEEVAEDETANEGESEEDGIDALTADLLAEEPKAEDGDEPKFTVRVNGKEFQVTEEQLKAGYQMGRDYSEKTTELAKERRDFVQERETFSKEKAQVLARSQAVYNELQLRFPIQNEMAEIEKLREIAPDKYAVAVIDLQRRQMAMDQLRQHNEQLRQEALAEAIPKNQSRLLEKYPKLRDPQIRAEIGRRAREVAVSMYEITPQEWDSNIDWRYASVMIDNTLMRERLKSSRGLIEQKVRGAPRVVRSGGSRDAEPTGQEVADRGLRSAMARLQRSGSPRDLGMLLDMRGKAKR